MRQNDSTTREALDNETLNAVTGGGLDGPVCSTKYDPKFPKCIYSADFRAMEDKYPGYACSSCEKNPDRV